MTQQRGLLDGIVKKIVVAEEEFVNPKFTETNSSVIVFVGEKAFKILKEGEYYGSDMKARHASLKEEMRINAEITPDFYLGIVPIIARDDQIQIMMASNPSQNVIEYALCMKRLKQESLVYNMLLNGTYSHECSVAITTKIAEFHNAKLSGNLSHDDRTLMQKFCSLESLKRVIEKNCETFERCKAIFVPMAITEIQFRKIKEHILHFLRKNKDLLTERINSGYVVPIHGDLHSKNIFVENDSTYLIDRSLRENLRVSDIVKDPAFLGMDLEAFGFQKEKERLFTEYLSKVRDPYFRKLLPFYMCHLAVVNAIVNLSHGHHNQIQRYLNLAYHYAR